MKEYIIPEKIYVPTTVVKKTKTRKGFLRTFFEQGIPATYSDMDHTELQTSKGKFRSVTDLVALTRSRFKKCSINAVLRILGELNSSRICYLVYCPRIKKVVVRPGSNSFVSDYSKSRYYKTEGVDGLSLKEATDIMLQETS